MYRSDYRSNAELSTEEKARLQAAIEEIATRYTERFPTEIQTPRIVGREAEFPVVDGQGACADVRRFWPALADSGDFETKYDGGRENLVVGLESAAYSYALEVGVGTLEVNTRPCADLFEIAQITEDAVRALVHAAARHGSQVLGYGIQPQTPPQLRIMAPKQRYESLYRAMGDAWLWYTVTASDQIQIDICRRELLDMLNYTNVIAPVIIALCGNSPVFGGELSRFCSAREGRMAQIHADEYRHGMPPRPYASVADYVAAVSQSTHLIAHADTILGRDARSHEQASHEQARQEQPSQEQDTVSPHATPYEAPYEIVPGSRPFYRHLVEHGADYDAFLFHEHYVWNSARVRVAYGTVEIRPACQQPWSEHMAAMALGLGLVEAHASIRAYLEAEFGPDYWHVLHSYHTQAIARGLHASQPAPDFLPRMVELAADGLRARGCGEEVFMTPLQQRLERRENPGQRVRRVFQIDGMPGLLAHTAIRPF